jgi:hypothetical protein
MWALIIVAAMTVRARSRPKADAPVVRLRVGQGEYPRTNTGDYGARKIGFIWAYCTNVNRELAEGVSAYDAVYVIYFNYLLLATRHTHQ